jgi:hypothetical protein
MVTYNTVSTSKITGATGTVSEGVPSMRDSNTLSSLNRLSLMATEHRYAPDGTVSFDL